MVTNKGGQCRNYKRGHVPLRKVEGTGSTETQHILNSIFKTDPSCMHNSTLISQEVHIDQIALHRSCLCACQFVQFSYLHRGSFFAQRKKTKHNWLKFRQISICGRLSHKWISMSHPGPKVLGIVVEERMGRCKSQKRGRIREKLTVEDDKVAAPMNS